MARFSYRYPLFLAFSLCLLHLVTASHQINSLLHRRHTLNATKRDAASFRRSTSLEKRFDNERFTFFEDGLGACGQTNGPNDFIVALNSAQYNGGQFCFQMITISANGQTTQAQIVDECPGCPYGGLDLSQGLFQFFAPLSVGVLTGSWNFVNAETSASQTPASTSAPPPPTSSPPPPSSTSSTSTTPTPTSVSSSISSSSSFSATSTSTTLMSTLSSTTTTSSTASTVSATPSSIPTAGTLGMFEEAIVQMALVIAGGAV